MFLLNETKIFIGSYNCPEYKYCFKISFYFSYLKIVYEKYCTLCRIACH